MPFLGRGSHNKNMFKLFLGLLTSISMVGISYDHLKIERLAHHRNLVVPPDFIKYFTLGFTNAVADIFWLRLIQDMDYCGGFNLTETKWDGREDQKPICRNGWVAKMFNLITELSPNFYLVYRVGVTALPIIVGDLEGAEKFIMKATTRYPNDWTIAYRSAYFYIFEKKDPVRAAELLKIAGQNGAPEWVLSLSARLYDEGGQLLLGIGVLEETIKATKEEAFRESLQKKLDKLKEKHQKLNK